jgi:ATP-binding cassette subfamily B (MDR/TAP) protein 1
MAQRDMPDPAMASHATPDLAQSAIDAEKEQANNEAQAVPTGIPFPVTTGLMAVRPTTSPDPAPTAIDSVVSRSEKARAPSSSGSSADSPGITEKKKPFSFGKKRKQQDEEEKKAKEKEEEATKARKVGFLELFRFARPLEITFNIIGLILAAASGAAQPLMTLIFGRLTNDFTAFGALTTSIASGAELTPAQMAQLEAAKDNLKTSAGHNALYLMAIGIGMFLTTWAYMFIWNWTGEVNAKRVRERYLHATLRQEVCTVRVTFARKVG